MPLTDRARFGMVLPHRSPDPIDMRELRQVAVSADALGFSDLWVTDNTLDSAFSFDPLVVLSYAAALTSRIRLGVSVLVLPLYHPLHVAHQVASLDYASGGRALLAVALGREAHYREFGVPVERRVARMLEQMRLMKALWTRDRVDFEGDFYHLEGARMTIKPLQQPHPPVWLGGMHPDAVRRAARHGDGWMGNGGSSTEAFLRCLPVLRRALEQAGRDPATFPTSKRVFMSVHEQPEVAREETVRWFGSVYRNPDLADTAGMHGTPSQVREQVEALVDAGVNHVLLNAVARYPEQVEALAEVVGLG